MPAKLKPGMDHEHYEWSFLSTRPKLRWPSGKPLALAVILLVEHVELYPPEGSVQAPVIGGFGAWVPFPNLPMLGHREYGHRVGIFRLLAMLDRHGLRPSVAIDAMAAERYPVVVRSCRESGAEVLGHGVSLSRVLSSRMSEQEERASIAESLARVRAATQEPVSGWMGPDQSESERTPRLLDEARIDYVCDWPNDEQPYFMSTPSRLVSVPTSWALDDSNAVWPRGAHPDAYAKRLVRSATQLMADGRDNARSLVLVLRPWLSGQPFRIDGLDQALGSILASEDVWAATTGEIAGAYRAVMG